MSNTHLNINATCRVTLTYNKPQGLLIKEVTVAAGLESKNNVSDVSKITPACKLHYLTSVPTAL